MLLVVLGIFAALVLIDIAIQIAGIFAILPILERSPPFAVEPTSPAPAADRVEFQTLDGLTLRGACIAPTTRRPWVW